MRPAEDAVHGRCRGHQGRQASEDVTWAWEVASRERRGRREHIYGLHYRYSFGNKFFGRFSLITN
jgi:hypothetical protein